MDIRITQVAALVFARRQAINFAGCVTELDSALREVWYVNYTLHWDHDDLVVFNVDGSRVVLAYGEHPHPDAFASGRLEPRQDPFGTTPMAGCLMIAIGPGPLDSAPTRVANHAEALLRVIVERFRASYPTDLVIWSEVEGVFNPDDFETILLDSVASLAEDKRALRQRLARHRPVPVSHRFDQPDVERLMLHLEGRIPQRPAPTPTSPPVPRTLVPSMPARSASRTPTSPKPTPSPATAPALDPIPALYAAEALRPRRALPSDLQRQRVALYPEQPPARFNRKKAEPMDPYRTAVVPTLPQRLTFYTLNTTLMLVALPVGSAILVYNMVRGEDLALSTRAIALSSTVVGLAQLTCMTSLASLV